MKIIEIKIKITKKNHCDTPEKSSLYNYGCCLHNNAIKMLKISFLIMDLLIDLESSAMFLILIQLKKCTQKFTHFLFHSLTQKKCFYLFQMTKNVISWVLTQNDSNELKKMMIKKFPINLLQKIDTWASGCWNTASGKNRTVFWKSIKKTQKLKTNNSEFLRFFSNRKFF